MEYRIYTSDELAHHGIKGMRWGIRRFQRKDGSLTPAGLKRKARLENELNQLGGKKKATDEGTEAAPRKKTIGEMTDDELREKTNRMRLENDYLNAQKNLAAANPQKVSAGKKFVNGLVNDVVAPAAKSAGRQWLEKFMKDKLGLNEQDPIAKLEKKVKKMELEKKLSDMKKDPEGDDDLVKALEFFRNTSAEDRQELKDAASMFENLDKIRKKGKSKD
jgi:hypothetical protein